MEVIKRLIDFYNRDPKPIFDHIRNVGIATIIVLGGRIALVKSSGLSDDIISLGQFVSWSLVIVGSILFILNMNYGVKSISRFFLGRHANVGIVERTNKIIWIIKNRQRISKETYKNILKFYFKEWGTQLVILVYYLTIMLIITSNALSSGLLDLEKSANSSDVYLNLNMISETLDKQNATISSQKAKNRVVE